MQKLIANLLIGGNQFSRINLCWKSCIELTIDFQDQFKELTLNYKALFGFNINSFW